PSERLPSSVLYPRADKARQQELPDGPAVTSEVRATHPHRRAPSRATRDSVSLRTASLLMRGDRYSSNPTSRHSLDLGSISKPMPKAACLRAACVLHYLHCWPRVPIS